MAANDSMYILGNSNDPRNWQQNTTSVTPYPDWYKNREWFSAPEVGNSILRNVGGNYIPYYSDKYSKVEDRYTPAGIDWFNPAFAPGEILGPDKQTKYYKQSITWPEGYGASGTTYGYGLTKPGQTSVPPIAEPQPPVQEPPVATPPVATPPPYVTEPLFPVNPNPTGTNLGQMQQYTPESFQYSDAYNNLANRLQSFNPSTDLAVQETQPVQWTPEQIQNMYKTQFEDLDRSQRLANQNISDMLQERFQGRSGQLITQLGDKAYDFNRQRENVMADVLGSILPKQEELTQGRQQLAQQAAALKNAGYQTGTSILNTLGGADVQKANVNLANIESAMNRTSQGIKDALAIGNFEEASRLSQMQMELEKAKMNMAQQGQSFDQNLQQQGLMGNILQTLLSYNLGEVGDATSRWNNYLNAILSASGA